MELPLTHWSFRSATDAEFYALCVMGNKITEERDPDQPTMPIEARMALWRHLPDYLEVACWAIWNPEQTEIVAGCALYLYELDQNRHIADIQLEVLPLYRNQGLGRRLLQAAQPAIIAAKRTMLHTITTNRIPAGKQVAERVGARARFESHVYELSLDQLDRQLLEQWTAIDEQTSAAFEIGFWETYSDDTLLQLQPLRDIVSQQYIEQLQMEPTQFSLQQLQTMKEMYTKNGHECSTVYVRERSTGRVVGYSEVCWNPNQPHLIHQLGTAVDAAYRQRSFGRWMKAAMLQHIIAQRPAVRQIRSTNEDTNRPILEINHRLGFRPERSQTVWELPTATLSHYLASEEKATTTT